MESPSTEALKSAIKICQTSSHYRTFDETNTLMNYLSRFEFFRNKAGDRGLNDVLQLASRYIKYAKIPAGEFLYHINQPSNHIYFVLHGEAWKFRPSTDIEFERDGAQLQKNATKATPKILQAIQLAKASNDRNKIPTIALLKNTNSPIRKSLKNLQVESPQRSFVHIPLNPEDSPRNKLESRSPTRKNTESSKGFSGFSQIKNRADDMNKIKAGLLKKLKDTKDALNFENDYFFGLVNRNSTFTKLYIKDKVATMKYDVKLMPYETIGEVSMSLTQVRTTSVLAYTDVHLFYLDQKSYEKVFFAQIEGVQEKLAFFKDYFKDVGFETFKRLCFLFTEKRFNLGEVVYKEGEHSNNLYFIKSGEVQLYKTVKPEGDFTPEFNDLTMKCNFSTAAKQASVGTVPSGLFFGEELLSKQKTRSFTAKSVSNLHCYIVRSEVVSRLPYHVIFRLREISASKQNWIEDRLENLKSLPLFKNIQRRLEVQGTPNESFGEQSMIKAASSNNLHQEKATKNDSPREKYATPPYKRKELTINSMDPNYSIFNNVTQSFSTFYKSDKPEDKTLRYYNPAFFPNTTKARNHTPTAHPSINIRLRTKTQKGHRLISYDNLKKTSRFGASTSTLLSGVTSPKDNKDRRTTPQTTRNHKIKIENQSQSPIPSKNNINEQQEPETLIHLDDQEDFNFNFVSKQATKTNNILSVAMVDNNHAPQTKNLIEDKLKRISMFSTAKRGTILNKSPECQSQERSEVAPQITASLQKSFRMPTSPSMEKKFAIYLSQKRFLSPLQNNAISESIMSGEDSKYSSPKYDVSMSLAKVDSRILDGSTIRESSFLIKKKPLVLFHRDKKSKGF